MKNGKLESKQSGKSESRQNRKMESEQDKKMETSGIIEKLEKIHLPRNMEENKDLHPKAEVPRDPDPDALGDRGAEKSRTSQTDRRNQEMKKNRDLEDMERKN